MINEKDLSWAAGVIDLKGRVTSKNNNQRSKSNPQTILFVETKIYEVVEELGRMTGIRPRTESNRHVKEFMRKGCSEHCPDKHVHLSETDVARLPPMTRWTITGGGMAVVLYNLLPYFRVNKGYSNVMTEVMARTNISGPGSGVILTSLRRLNILGWQLPSIYKSIMD